MSFHVLAIGVSQSFCLCCMYMSDMVHDGCKFPCKVCRLIKDVLCEDE